MISLSGKKIFVAGATGAIGRAILEEAKQAGAWVAGTYFENESEARALESQGVAVFKADLRDRDQARRCLQEVLGQVDQLDGLVYAAGNTADHTLKRLSDADWDQVLQLHLEGLVAMTQAALDGMRRQKHGKIVALGSVAGSTGRVGQANYAAAKAATVAFIKTVAKEEGRFGIAANVVSPGFVDSKMTRSASQQVWEKARADSALGTLSSTQVVASFTSWLLSDLCDGVTGQLFSLDSRVLA